MGAMAEQVLFITSTRIGDAALSTGVLSHLVETRRAARFTVACGPLAAPLFRAAPRLERVIAMPKQAYGGHWLRLWRETVGTRWSQVVDLRGSRTSWFLRAGARSIAGRQDLARHKVEDAAAVLGISPAPNMRLWFDEEARAAAAAAVAPNTAFLALAPFAAAPFKEWPAERFAALAARLTGPHGALAGAQTVILGGPGDGPAAHAIADAIPSAAPDTRPRVIAGADSVDVLSAAALLARTRLFVGNCSGLLHLASASGAPTVGLYGPTSEHVYGPRGPRGLAIRAGADVDARARATLRHADASLMTALSVEPVAAACTAFVERVWGSASEASAAGVG